MKQFATGALLGLLVTTTWPATAQPNVSSPTGETPPPSAGQATVPTMADYEAALAQARGAAKTARAAGPEEVRAIVETAQHAMSDGRLTEAIAALVALTDTSRFHTVANAQEGRAALLTLGDAWMRAGAPALARPCLRRALGSPTQAITRAATHRLTELALEAEDYRQGLDDLAPLLRAADSHLPEELSGERDYLLGRKAEATGDSEGAEAAYARITPRSRFWSAATYRRGLLAVDRARLDQAEALFCKVADPRRQDGSVPVFADERFFAIRDLARLALGRVAHEGLRHDDAHYYYYLVPQDSKRLAEALYEAATTRYEASDLPRARQLLDQLERLGPGHPYEDEARVLDAYVDIARCDFVRAQHTLDAFLAHYESLHARVVRILEGPDEPIVALLASSDETATRQSDWAPVIRRLESDPALLSLLQARRRLVAQLLGLSSDHQDLGRLLASVADATSGAVQDPHAPSWTDSDSSRELRLGVMAISDELNRLAPRVASQDQLTSLQHSLEALSAQVETWTTPEAIEATSPSRAGVPGLLERDRAHGASLWAEGQRTLAEIDTATMQLGRDALRRLERRMTRLLARANLAKIDVLLGRKKGLEIEVEALRQGILPAQALDSARAAEYLRDNEEYWPFEGDEWLDEVVGVEQGER